MDWNQLADRALSGAELERRDALAVLESGDDELLGVLHASFRIRQRYHGRDVRIHVLQNAKSGLCPEDCAFCSQSARFHTGVDRYQVLSVDELYEGAVQAAALGHGALERLAVVGDVLEDAARAVGPADRVAHRQQPGSIAGAPSMVRSIDSPRPPLPA